MPEALKQPARPNSNLQAARKAKNDEFYTRLQDIEKELRHYKTHFRGKTVFCNCDDPYVSNFFKYFFLNFDTNLGLKKLIAACYKSRNLFAFSKEDSERAASAWYEGGQDETALDERKLPNKLLKEDGDFRSAECVEFLKEADIVCTNPPFSLFREYVAQLIKYKKNFLIIGNMQAVTYKDFFPLIQENKIWLGVNPVKEFIIPSGATQKFGNVRWFTNLPHKNRNDEISLYKEYDSAKYPNYDNYNAISVDNVSDIPHDYDGEMGVPISFVEKYNPSQFEIVGMDSALLNKSGDVRGRFYINGTRKYARIIIKKK